VHGAGNRQHNQFLPRANKRDRFISLRPSKSLEIDIHDWIRPVYLPWLVPVGESWLKHFKNSGQQGVLLPLGNGKGV
jgi:hypothetical protein